MKILKHLLLALTLTLPLSLFAADAVNINTADKETLTTALKGIGDKKAEAIIDYREQNGPFKSIEELSNVKGIGESTVEANKAVLSINNE